MAMAQASLPSPPCGDGAIFDKSGRYRYLLWRNLSGTGTNVLSIIMLNPSLADADSDDPTIASCVRLTRNNGYDGLIVANLYAFLTPYPRELFAARDPVGRLYGRNNDAYIELSQRLSRSTLLAWGNQALVDRARIDSVLKLLKRERCLMLGLTERRQPRHPLYVAATTKMQKASALWG